MFLIWIPLHLILHHIRKSVCGGLTTIKIITEWMCFADFLTLLSSVGLTKRVARIMWYLSCYRTVHWIYHALNFGQLTHLYQFRGEVLIVDPPFVLFPCTYVLFYLLFSFRLAFYCSASFMGFLILFLSSNCNMFEELWFFFVSLASWFLLQDQYITTEVSVVEFKNFDWRVCDET
jgi:hypothetical protein